MSGKIKKKSGNQIDEAQIVAWLAESPDFFTRHPGSLSSMELPVDSGTAISLHQYQVRVLREEKVELVQKLGSLLKNVKTNHKIHSDLLGLAGSMVSLAREGAKTPAYLALIKQHFALLDVKLIDKTGFPEAFKILVSLVGKADSACNDKPDAALRSLLFEANAARVLSIAVVPVKHGRKCHAYLVLAADDEERFKPGMGGEFLKLLAQLVSSLIDDAR
ncbi:MAG: DUF484 family protein [Proteobacteria bacterium]|nr:DUF484 family protein [Pseudomonadota bacterium]